MIALGSGRGSSHEIGYQYPRLIGPAFGQGVKLSLTPQLIFWNGLQTAIKSIIKVARLYISLIHVWMTRKFSPTCCSRKITRTTSNGKQCIQLAFDLPRV